MDIYDEILNYKKKKVLNNNDLGKVVFVIKDLNE